MASVCRVVVVLPAPHLGGCRTREDPQSKAHTAAGLVSPSCAQPIETHVVLFFLAVLLLCYCMTRGPPGSVLVRAAVQQQLRCELPPT